MGAAAGSNAQVSRPRAAGAAAAAVWLPQLAPFLVGPLTECDHCVSTYLGLFAGLPATVPMLAALDSGAAGRAAAVALTLALVAGLAWLLRRVWRRRLAVLVPVALLSAVHAVGLSHALRA